MGQFSTRGLPEVPLGIEPQLRRFLIDLRQTVHDLRGPQAPPATPTNFKVTPEALANLLQWTPVADADYHVILWNTVPSLTNAFVAASLVAGGQYVDYVGQANVKRWYWIRAHRFTGSRSTETPAQAGTTLAAGTAVAPPTPPPVGTAIANNQRTGGIEPLRQIR